MGVYNYTSERGVVGPEFGDFHSDEELVNVVLFSSYSEVLLQFAAACCVIFIIIGIPGNLITIVALARYKKVRNATAIFIINLHISNLIFISFILPMTAMTFAKGNWTHSWIMCRMYAYFKFVLNSASIFSVLAITINRYIIVCHPLLYPNLYKRRNILISILMIWASGLVIFMAPIFGVWGRFDLEPSGGFCTMLPDRNGNSPKKFLLITAFVGPYLTMSLCYSRIWCVMKAAKKIQSKNPRATRPTHLPLPKVESFIAKDRNTLTSDASSPSNFITTDSEKTPTSSVTSVPQSPRDKKALENYFKAPFRLTRKLVRRKAPTNRDKRLCAMIAAIMLSFCISHLPVMATKLAYMGYKSKPAVNVFAHLLEYSGTCMNPIIYVLMSKEYRQAYQSLFEAIMKSFIH